MLLVAYFVVLVIGRLLMPHGPWWRRDLSTAMIAFAGAIAMALLG